MASLTRLIPARAGNIRKRKPHGTYAAAHPRSRGEHFLRSQVRFAESGSSPLARGTLARPRRRYRVGRLIPARAGNIAFVVF